MIGPWEIFMILLVVLLLFGAGRLPQIMGDVAKGIKSFKQGLKDEDAAAGQKDLPEDPKRIAHQPPGSSASSSASPESARHDAGSN